MYLHDCDVLSYVEDLALAVYMDCHGNDDNWWSNMVTWIERTERRTLLTRSFPVESTLTYWKRWKDSGPCEGRKLYKMLVEINRHEAEKCKPLLVRPYVRLCAERHNLNEFIVSGIDSEQ